LSSSSGHQNNGDGNVRYETLVDLAATSASPVGLVPPIVDCPINAVCTFSVPATDPDGQPMAWRLSTAVEAGGSFVQPTGASVNANNGLYTWDTTGAVLAATGSTFYSTQVMIENVVGGNVISRTAVDFFIRLGSNSSNSQPVFTTPTPANGDVVNGTVGSPLSFGVAASDADAADTVTLSVLGSPAGATFTPSAGNPATGSFAWTPTAVGDYTVTLLASDNQGLGAVPRTVTLHITTPGGNPPPFVDAGPAVSGNTGAAVSLDGTVTDTEPVTTAWTAVPGAGVDPASTCTFGNAAAVDTTVTCTDDGTWTLKLTANDGTNAAVSDTTTLTVTNPPPTVDAGTNRAGNEGSAIALDGTVIDSEPVTTRWTVTPGAGVDAGATCAFANAAAVDTTVTCTDDGTWTVKLSGNDGTNSVVSDSATVTVSNVKPTVDITAPAGAAVYDTGTPVPVSATVGDAGGNDTLACSIDWGDGTVTPGTRTGSTCTGSHTYAVDGGQTITVTVTDDDGGSAFDTVGVLIDTVVVAPQRQKVTGGGFIKPDGDRVSFAFVARTRGTGFAGQLVTKDGKDKFKGTSVATLKVTGKRASWSGTGKWKGQAKYTFKVQVEDNRHGNKGGRDKFEIVVKNSSGTTVFSASGPVKGGKITIH
ncbi:MAG: post-COAP-1 domain-containing protein, partial [Nocardioides sp.]